VEVCIYLDTEKGSCFLYTREIRHVVRFLLVVLVELTGGHV
jgi:hypothetical protein